MSDTPWTPGPWKIRRPDHGARQVVTVPGAVSQDRKQNLALTTTGQARLADVFGSPWSEEAEANARLIAAAPEMAELLESVALLNYDMGTRARALLSRIRGENNDPPGPSPRLLAERE